MGWDMERAEDEYWENQARFVKPQDMNEHRQAEEAAIAKKLERLMATQSDHETAAAKQRQRIQLAREEQRQEKARILAELYGSKWADEKQVAEITGVNFTEHGTITGRIQYVEKNLPPYHYIVHPGGRMVTREGKEVGNVDEYELGGGYNLPARRVTSPSQDLSHRIAALKAQQAELEAQKAFLDALPKEPSSGENNDLNPVVHFKKRFSPTGTEYDYVVVRASNNLWYASGPQSPKGYTWHELLLWLLETSPSLELPQMRVSYIEDWADLDTSGEGHQS